MITDATRLIVHQIIDRYYTSFDQWDEVPQERSARVEHLDIMKLF